VKKSRKLAIQRDIEEQIHVIMPYYVKMLSEAFIRMLKTYAGFAQQ